jgi:DsbC/DsbD-like thiol-disulfide interchange protein
LPGAPGAVTARASAPKPATVAPGGEFEVGLTLTIKPGYHIYANPPGSEDVIATALTLKSGAKAELLEVNYPDGESKVLAASGKAKVNVYEKETTLTARVRLAPDASPGTSTVVLRVRYQACDDRACLAPATLEVPATVEVKGR